ncbi:MAG: TonB family protein [Nitrospinota bacterium]|nr:TonB family protein [Nitrospinota bacterium]
MNLQTEPVLRRKSPADSIDTFIKACIYSLSLHVVIIIAVIIASLFKPAFIKKPTQESYAVHLIDPGPLSTATTTLVKEKTNRKTDKFEAPSKSKIPSKQIAPVESKVSTKTADAVEKKSVEKEIKKEDEAAAAQLNKQKTGGTIDIKKFPYEWYLIAMETKIYGNWDTLMVTTLSSSTIRVLIYFQIDKNGKLKAVKVEESSNDEFIDKSALEAVKMSEPFPPLPPGYKEDILEVHFGFKITSRH